MKKPRFASPEAVARSAGGNHLAHNLEMALYMNGCPAATPAWKVTRSQKLPGPTAKTRRNAKPPFKITPMLVPSLKPRPSMIIDDIGPVIRYIIMNIVESKSTSVKGTLYNVPTSFRIAAKFNQYTC